MVLGLAMLIGIFAVMATVTSSGNLVWAANFYCTGSSSCTGTDDPDKMQGDGQANNIDGREGSDLMDGGAGSDQICGDTGDDQISGGSGEDLIFGDSFLAGDCGTGGQGADKISGGLGNDKIFHGGASLLSGSDSHKDIIDCGPGTDEVWINISVDHDVSANCETVHAG